MAMEAISEAQSIVMLRSSDNKMFQVEKGVACELIAVKNMIEDTGMDQPIPLPNVSSNILAKVIEYCKYHVDNRRKALSEQRQVAAADNVVKAWDQDFINVDQGTLFDLILAANYLNIKDLLELTCQTVADMIKGKTPEEIRMQFNIKNDFTPEEEEQIQPFCIG
ncbi:unnamed protein product [Sphagnum troendelagicum]|uniref:SKP1-like protein n=2 Tax=Sphagnum TaxID=13804 RepID=A0ABP0TMW7_9BRYO